MRLLVCCVAAVVYIWQEQKEFMFSPLQLAVVIPLVGVMSLGLCLFVHSKSPIQPPEPVARRVALHRQAHPGNLRHPACRF